MSVLLLCMAYDVRAIANWVLDLADTQGWQLTNFSTNKVVFFLHADFLVEFKEPLVGAKIEAWKHGPVFRELYAAFKNFENKPVKGRVTALDANDGERKICEATLSLRDTDFLKTVCPKYAALSTSALYALAHETGGPWDQVWNHDDDVNAFMRITDEAILRWWALASRH